MSVITAYVRLSEGGLRTLRGNPDWLEAIDEGHVRGAATIDLDKAGDGLVWLLLRIKGANPALVSLLSGEAGVEEAELESPYGDSSRLLTAELVRSLSAWLTTIDVQDLRAVYEPKAMARAGVYPQIWMQQGAAALEEYLLPHFRRLGQFVADASAQSQCILVYFS